MDALSVRPAVLADLDALIALYLDDTLGRGRESIEDREVYAAAFARVASDPSTCVYAAEMNGALVGTFQLTITPGVSRRGAIRATIESVRTRADLRGRGIGARMMDFAMEEARQKGANVMQLTSDLSREAAHRFYQRLGFRHSHAGFKRDLSPR